MVTFGGFYNILLHNLYNHKFLRMFKLKNFKLVWAQIVELVLICLLLLRFYCTRSLYIAHVMTATDAITSADVYRLRSDYTTSWIFVSVCIAAMQSSFE